ncbi:MAG: DUF5082 domain-containing protein [Propionibacteriaceae bacterium]|jgi:NTP pyrophosphatase (non-canonical NTP hydrolase)|nr:DUF5082 domain-containing protein [Propionibacteriaceae bacterium]
MSDTDSMRREANRKSAEKSRAEDDKRAIEDQIERLRSAERQLATEKTETGEVREAVRQHEDPGETWAGQTRDQYHDHVKDALGRDLDAYRTSTDAMLDAVIHRITELENQSRDLGGVIGWLANAINGLWADIRSAVN